MVQDVHADIGVTGVSNDEDLVATNPEAAVGKSPGRSLADACRATVCRTGTLTASTP